MKKQKKFESLNFSEICVKQNEMIKELLTFNLSMDLSAIKSSNGLVNLKRDLKTVSRIKAKLERNEAST
jgi:hypothetical protein